MKNFYLKFVIICFLIGVGFGKMNLPIIILFNGFLTVVLLMIVLKKIKYLTVILVAFIFLLIGDLRYLSYLPVIDDSSVHYYQNPDKQILLQGIIDENPDRRRDKVNYTVDVKRIKLDDKWKSVSGRILVSFDLYPEFFYGDLIEIKGNLLQPANFDTFSYENYLSLFRVYSVMYSPQIKVVKSNQASAFFAFMFNLKSSFEAHINSLFPEPEASFTAGLLTGSRKGIPDELMTSFNITGLTHIIAISGYNISLIIFFVSSFLSKASRKAKVPVIIVFVVLFTLFVGASPAVVRASIMGIISVVAMWFGRQSQVINALLASAFIMVLMNPNVLFYDVGFQLSFLATLGLILKGEYIKQKLSFLPEFLGIREGIAMTFSAQVFALPVILLNFQRFSLISPVANILVVPFLPFAMLFGFISTILSYLNFSFGFVFTFLGIVFLKWMIETVSFLAKIPFASIQTEWFNIYLFIAYYSGFILFSDFVHVYLRNIFRRFRRFNVNRLPPGDLKSV